MKIFIEPEFSAYYQEYPLVLVDVGASGGIESHWKPAMKYLNLIGFEPDDREFSNLKKKENGRIQYLNTGLYSEKKTLNYYLTEKQQTSSIFKPNRAFLDRFPEAERFNVTKNVTINMDTLDNQFKVHNIKDTDFIKVDTQGSELFILEGAVNTLREYVFGIEVEVEFVEMYKNQPLFADVDTFLRKQSFELFDIQSARWKRSIGKEYYKKRGQLIFGNVLYLRELNSFCKMMNSIQDERQKKGKILRAMAICFLYGYFDYAMEIFSVTTGMFSGHERQAIERKIKKSKTCASWLPNFRGRQKISDLIYSLWEFLTPTHNGWATLDRKIGNI